MRESVLSLPIARYELRFRSEQAIAFRGYTGSAWRGIFGHALKKTVCITRCPACADCMLYRSCVYPYIFETPVPPGSQKLRNIQTIPHPFLLEVPWKLHEPSPQTSVRLALFGHANRYLAYAVHAFAQASEKGLQHSGPFGLDEVLQEECPGTDSWIRINDDVGRLNPIPTRPLHLPNMPSRIRIVFETPLRLRHLDKYVTPDLFRFSSLFRSLLGRISSLKYFHSDQPLETDFVGVVAASRLLDFTTTSVSWVDWTRYSSRQKQKLQMGGLIGSAELDLTHGEKFWPFLWLGQFTHAGKGTSMGLGKFRLEAVPGAA